MVPRECGLCQQRQYRRGWRSSGYDIGRCETCGLMQVLQDVQDEELKLLYGRGYYHGENSIVYQDYLADPEVKGALFGEKLDAIAREFNLKPGACLEVGCAFGLFLNQARLRGWSVRGIERSSHAANWARVNFGIDVDSSLEAWDAIPSGSQDLVVMWDVIEHVKHPLTSVQHVRRVLRPGGLLVLSTGDVRSLGARVYGRRWFLIAPPYHLFYFDHDSIRRLLQTAGLAIRRIENHGAHPLDNGGRNSIGRWLSRHDRYIGWRLRSGSIMEVVAHPSESIP